VVAESLGYPRSFRVSRCAALLLAILLAPGCASRESDPLPLTAEVPLHLEEHLDAATIVGSEVPDDASPEVKWSFDEPQPAWKATAWNPIDDPLRTDYSGDALRVFLTESDRGIRVAVAAAAGERPDDPRLAGAIYVDLPDWNREEWGHVLVRARTTDDFEYFALGFNRRREPFGSEVWEQSPFLFSGQAAELISDGAVQTYLLPAETAFGFWQGPWQQLGLMIAAAEPAILGILSVRVIPKEAAFADARAGVKTLALSGAHRRALYTHTPSKREYRVRVPEAGRLDVGLGVLRGEAPVTFRIRAEPVGGEPELLLEEAYAGEEGWAQPSSPA